MAHSQFEATLLLTPKHQEMFDLKPPATVEMSKAVVPEKVLRCLAKQLQGTLDASSGKIRDVRFPPISTFEVDFFTYNSRFYIRGRQQVLSPDAPWNQDGIAPEEAVRRAVEFMQSKGKTVDATLLDDQARRVVFVNSGGWGKLSDRAMNVWEREEERDVKRLEQRMKQALEACVAEVVGTRGASELAVSRDLYPGFGKDVSRFLVNPKGSGRGSRTRRQKKKRGTRRR